MTDISGATLKGYELKEQIGTGAFGAVYRAVQPQVGREVAIKVILPEHANRPDFIRRFEAEAHLVAQLEHLHIVPLYDYWRDPDGAYLVMRLMQGGSLQDALLEKSLDLSEVSRIVDQIGAALAAAHHKGVVHRDLKPANILLDDEGNAYLSDFGIAKELGLSQGMTGTGSILGSPGYLSPEQVQSEPVSPQTDIYSLGVVLYELLVGQHPFPDTPVGALLLKQVNQPLPCVNDRSPDLPKGLDAVVQRATAKKPDERFANLNEFAAAFQTALGTQTLERFLTAEEAAALANPYKGLRAFMEADAADFFGREALTRLLLARMMEPGDASRFLAVVGPSGSGKSSVVRAGLIPALRNGALPGSQDWFIVEMVPGTHPMEELALGLEKIAVHRKTGFSELLQKDNSGISVAARMALPSDDDELLLVIDQFEELFTLSEKQSSVDFFLDSLHAAICDPGSPLRVILTLRADFYDRPLMHAVFGGLVEQRTQVVLPLTGEELGDAIRCPAARVGAVLEEGLVTEIVADLGKQPGALPLLQYALTELFERREGLTLNADAYGTIGGVFGALGRRAEEVYSNLEMAEQDNARQLFLRLVTLGEGMEDTRRRALQSELESIHTAELEISDVLDAFGEARLLTFDRDPITRGPTVEVAHEALLREWHRLREWLDESRADLRIQRLLGRAAREWQASRQDASFLLRGTRLEQYAGWADETTIALTEHELVYLDASLEGKRVRDADEAERQERELALEKRSRRILQALVGVFALAAVVAVILTAFAFNQQGIAQTESTGRATQQAIAEEQAAIAQENAAVAQSESDARATQQVIAEQQVRLTRARELALAAFINLDIDPQLSLLLGLEAINVTYQEDEGITKEAQEALHSAIPAASRLVQSIDIGEPLYGITYNEDGSQIIVGGPGDIVKVWDTATQEIVATLSSAKATSQWSPLLSPDGNLLATCTANGFLLIWDPETWRNLLTIDGQVGQCSNLAFSKDGSMIAMAGWTAAVVWDVDASLQAGTGVKLRTFPAEVPPFWAVEFSADGSAFYAGGLEGAVRSWDLDSGEMLETLPPPGSWILDFEVGLDGSWFAASSGAGPIRIWDAHSNKTVANLTAQVGPYWLAQSHDGRLLGSSGGDGTIRVWDTRSWELLRTFSGHHGAVMQIRFSPDASHIASVSEDGTIKIWDLGPARELITSHNHSNRVTAISFNQEGNRMATFGWDGLAIIWEVTDSITEPRLKLLRTLDLSAPVNDGSFSPDGSVLATGSADGNVTLWQTETGQKLQTILAYDVSEMDGLFVAGVVGLAFSPDGTLLATGGVDGVAKIWELDSGQLLTSFDGHGPAIPGMSMQGINRVAFTPDGSQLVTAGNDGYVILWSIGSGNALLKLSDGSSSAFAVAFNSDGSRLATTRDDGSVQVWDLEDASSPNFGQELFSMTGHSAQSWGVAFSPDDQWFVTTDFSGGVKIWDATTGEELLNLATGNWGIAISQDGTQIAAGSSSGEVYFYVLQIENLIALAESRLVRDFTLQECQQYHIEPCPITMSNK
jgi:WD40 repeat protein